MSASDKTQDYTRFYFFVKILLTTKLTEFMNASYRYWNEFRLL